MGNIKRLFIGSFFGLILAYFMRFFHCLSMALSQAMKKLIIQLTKALIYWILKNKNIFINPYTVLKK